MQRTFTLILAIVALALPARLQAQQSGENLANSIIAARKKNAATMAQYNWNCRTELTKDGQMQDIRIDMVNLGPDGMPQRTLQNDDKAQLPGFFVRKRLEEKQRKDLEKYFKGFMDVLDSYTMPMPGKLIDFVVSGKVQPITSPDGKPLLQITGGGIVNPGDTMVLTIDPKPMLAARMQITTMYDGHSATVDATFKQAKSGLNHLQFATVDVPDLNANLAVHNYDYVPND